MPGGQGQRCWLSARLDETYHISTRTTQDDRPHHRGRCAARLRSHICLDHLLRDGDHLPLCRWNAAPDAIAAVQHQHRRVTCRCLSCGLERGIETPQERHGHEPSYTSRACGDCRIDLDGRDARSRRDPTSQPTLDRGPPTATCSCGPRVVRKKTAESQAQFFSLSSSGVSHVPSVSRVAN